MKLNSLPANPTPAHRRERRRILMEGHRQRAEIDQMHRDVEHWNDSVRKPHEKAIPVDPDGQDARLAADLDEMLDAELWCVHIKGPDDVLAAPSRRAAEERCWKLNDHFEKMAAGDATREEVLLKAVVDLWPHSPEQHAKDVKEWDTGDGRLSSIE